MNPYERAFYNSLFKIAFYEAKGEAFQDFFNALMGRAYPDNYIPSAPWGNIGDKKNDGYLSSQRMLFQVYAPRELEAKETIKKINEDFAGAYKHWEQYFSDWCFVHNAPDGLPAPVLECILKLRENDSSITHHHWSLIELLREFERVPLESRRLWLGDVPNQASDIESQDIELIITTIHSRRVPDDVLTPEVPQGKIEANGLSEDVQLLLNNVKKLAPKVEGFFATYPDLFIESRVAEQFKGKYLELKNRHFSDPDLIFSELQKWAGGLAPQKPKRQNAVLAILAYFFEKCTIFEAPRSPDDTAQ